MGKGWDRKYKEALFSPRDIISSADDEFSTPKYDFYRLILTQELWPELFERWIAPLTGEITPVDRVVCFC